MGILQAVEFPGWTCHIM